MKKTTIFLATALCIGASFISCEKEYDSPPVATIPEGSIIDVATLKGMYNGSAISIQDEYSIFGVITTDESTGNFYKEAYFQDATGALNLRFTASSSFQIGDSVRLYLKGAVLSEFDGVTQLDSMDVDRNVIIQENNVAITPLNLSLQQASTGLAQLVQIDNVEFVSGELGSTWADADGLQSVNLNITDCNGNTMLVRTSGYSNFAGDVIPEGNGSIIGIVGQFGTDLQLYIRDPQELTMNGNRCTGGGSVTCNAENSISENFLSFTTGASAGNNCWETAATTGTLAWTIQEISGNKVAQASILGTSSTSNEMWLVSPEINYSSSGTVAFETAVQNWNHDGLTPYILTNYSGNPISATQYEITSATIAGSGSGNDVLVPSGTFNISNASISSNYRLAFKYNASGSGGQTSTYKVDNIVITQ